MTRTHIHFSTGLPEDPQGVVSGMRKDAEMLIYIDIRQSLEDGGVWWISSNGVVLTEGDSSGILPTKYFSKVVGRKDSECPVLWEAGEKVADLPVALHGRKAPFGKGGIPKSNRGGGGGGGRGRGRGRDEKRLDGGGESSIPSP